MMQKKQEPIEKDIDQVMKHQMEQMVGSYDDYMKKMTFGREHLLRQQTVELAGIKPGDSVLEVGCGTGSLTLAAKIQAGPTGKVFGIDIIPGMLEASKQKAAQAHEDITFQEGSISNIPFPENFFNVVMCSFMIFHMSEATRNKGLTEIYRVLKSEGQLLIVDLAIPEQPIQKTIAKIAFSSFIGHDLHELIPQLKGAGFTHAAYASMKFRIFGLSLIGYLKGNVNKV